MGRPRGSKNTKLRPSEAFVTELVTQWARAHPAAWAGWPTRTQGYEPADGGRVAGFRAACPYPLPADEDDDRVRSRRAFAFIGTVVGRLRTERRRDYVASTEE